MTFQFFQVPDSEQSAANPPSLNVKWKAAGSRNRSFVEAYAMGATPAVVATSFGTLYRQDLRVQQSAYNQWNVEVPYGKRKNESGSWTWDFDTTGGKVHITQAKEEVGRYPAATAPDQKGAIAVDGDEVKGTEVTVGAGKFNVQLMQPMGVVTMSYFRYLMDLTGGVNSDPFLGFAPGEVLFLGGRGSDGSESKSTVNLSYAVSRNATLSIGDIANIQKKGWDFLWVRYEDAEETADGVTHPVRKPLYAYVDRVYKEIPMAVSFGFGA